MLYLPSSSLDMEALYLPFNAASGTYPAFGLKKCYTELQMGHALDTPARRHNHSQGFARIHVLAVAEGLFLPCTLTPDKVSISTAWQVVFVDCSTAYLHHLVLQGM